MPNIRSRGIRYVRGYKNRTVAYTLHKPVRYRFKRNRVVAGIDDEMETDLVIIDSLSKHNNGYKYILTGMSGNVSHR